MVIVNNKSYVGRSVNITNSRVIINGVDVTPENEKVITITIDGDCESINADACDRIEVKGNVTNNVKTMSGDVSIGGTVGGDVKTMSGDVKCGPIGGSVSTMSGDIKNQK